jgi:uncharacterized membrane protein YqjE
MDGTDRPSGLFGSLRRLSGDFVELAQVRLELFATELQQEKLRALEGLAWLGVTLLAFGIGLVLFSVFVVLLVGAPYRLAALGLIVLLHLGLAALAWRLARARLRDGTPFEASVAELRRDRAALAGRDATGLP